MTSPTANAPRSPATRQYPGHPPTCPCSTNWPNSSAPLAATERAASRRRAADQAERAEALQYAAQLVTQLAADDAIVLPPLEVDAFTNWIADRNTEAGAGGMLAERAPQDRTWAYGHVIVDEAQELSPMAWRMVLRRCPPAP